MKHLVNAYLIVTGIVAALVLMMPWLVILGTFLLIVPGLILAAAPTAFLWGFAFAVPWYALRPMLGDYGAIVPAALIAGAIFWLVPQASLSESKARLARSIRPEVVPAQPIPLAGHVFVDTFSIEVEKPDPGLPYDKAEIERRPYVCDALCAALLATPGVASVTVNSHGSTDQEAAPLTGHARTFRIIPKSQCTGPTVRPKDADALGITKRARSPAGIRRQLVGTLQAEWDVRLSTTDCIVAEPPRDRYDFIIRKHNFRAFTEGREQRGRWSLAALSVSVERLEVTDGAGRILLSKTLARTDGLSPPLRIAPRGGMENFRFEWARSYLSNDERYFQLNANQLLADHTSLRTEVDYAAVVQASRDRLADALADPALPASDAAFKLSDPWIRSLAGQTVGADDLALLAKAIRDPRVSDFGGIWDAIRAAGDRARELRAPMIERIASLDESSDWRVKGLGKAVDLLPAGTFATLTGTERAILADPVRRRLAPGLISRQSDRGAAAVPMLVDMLEYHLREIARSDSGGRRDRSADLMLAGRAGMALCMLGRDGSAALPAIDRLSAEGLVPRHVAEGRDWQLMLARIGKPVTAIPKPENLSGTEAQFHRNLQMRLERFRPDRDCRSSSG